MSVTPEVRAKALDFLNQNRLASIATVSLGGEPRASTLYYIIDDDFTFYFLTTSDSKKVANLRENPRLAFSVSHDFEPATMQGGGKVEFIEKDLGSFIMRFSDKLATDKARQWPILVLPHVSYIVVKLKPEWLTWLTMDMNHPETYKEGFRTIIP